MRCSSPLAADMRALGFKVLSYVKYVPLSESMWQVPARDVQPAV